MASSLPRSDIAGATVAIVKDGKILLTKGYGYADAQKRVPVDADRHLFRVASISKLFTWTAVMQQVERGRIDLDADINRYLDFKIPPFHGKPLTMRHLMTHTAGFELVMRNLFRASPDGVKLGDRLKQWVPDRLYAPGTTPTYSNYATALGAYVVERVSGERFEDYSERHILGPLGMARSSFRQPLPAPLARDLSNGYLLGSGAPFPFEYTAHIPAGGLTSTAPDIARFMIAHLNGGVLGEHRILQEASARTMHASPYAMLPPLHGMGLGFAQHDINGHRVIVHDGDTRFFHSQLNLFPDDNVGLFLSLNSTGRDGAMDMVRSAFFKQFADRYFPAADARAVTAPGVDPKMAAKHARAMIGHYIASDRSASNFLAINSFRFPTVVEIDDEGQLLISSLTGADGAPKRWREVAPFLWHEVGGHDRLAAQLVDGKPVRFANDEYAPLVVWDRQPWWRSTAWLTPLSQIAFATLLLTLVTIPVQAAVRWRDGKSVLMPPFHRGMHVLLWLAALAGAVVPSRWVALIQPIMTFTADDRTIEAQILGTSLLTFFAYVGGLLAALTVCWLAWTKSGWFNRSWNVAVATSFGVCAYIAWTYNLLSFNTGF
ncbi:CubicO group peptidase (beta-lactamase class C family) [Sphingopyxis panaciterrae]|uniref:serine hydrolase domain-containing protein n=1 Tax=Sphingopyxis panaciterrae TaxID=363841 RepID=UPI0014232510|nr:serine hydrolase domain-containing protein [Sphingopyxis panaciterrae]NIJ37376.1 CubicO group peptidase (beta-lactamase class C family) [Sphingopyxis panaciterrae]